MNEQAQPPPDAKGTRTERAGLAAMFAYLQFGLSITVGVALVPFVLHHVGARLYGYWLASGEVLAYAAMADLGVMGVVPWLIAEADGRKDRQGIRRLMSTAFCAAVVVAVTYAILVLLLWRVAPSVLRLAAADRAAIVGPLTLIAIVTAIVMPARIFGAVLMGLQDVKFYGALSSVNWAIDLAITVTLLLKGYGLYALALGAAVPSTIGVVVMFARVRVIAPDLMSGWPRPSGREVARLFREGFGTWLGSWGWRLSAATDAIVLASLGNPIAITMLAMTSKLGQMLTQMSWVPGDSSLVGLAQLSGEERPDRMRHAVAAIFRVYLALATAGTCVVLAVNGAFVRGWVGGHLFGGGKVNAVLATLIIVGTVTHAIATMTSVLGKRLHVGAATLVAGVVQVGLAIALSRQFGVIGVPIAALLAHVCVLIPSLIPAFSDRTGLTPVRFARDVIRPWAVRSLPLMAICAFAGLALYPVPMWVSIPLGGLTALLYLWLVRDLVLGYPPVAAMIRARLASVRLEGLFPVTGVEHPPGPVMEFGTGEAFRHASWLERVAARFRGPLARSPLKRPLALAFEAVLDRLPGDRLISHFPHGESVRLAAAFRHVSWNAEEYHAFRSAIAAGETVLDVGANLGAYAVLFGQWVGPAGRVFAFEPAPATRLGLERQVALNGLDDRIVVRPEAMADKEGTVRFRASGRQGDNRIMKGDRDDAPDRIEVATTSIDAFCRERHLQPGFIKVDVEGAELDVLRGARETIAANASLGLYMEMHPRLWPAFGTSQAEIEEELARQRLRPERLDGRPDVWSLEGVCLRMTRCGS